MEKVNYNNIADVYDYRYQKSYSADGIHQILQEIKLRNNIKTILEIGCGTGHWLNVFEEDTTVMGVDPSFAMLAKAKKTESSYSLVQGSSNQLPIKNNSIDFIYCINAIHHFDYPEQFIKDCAKILNQNGIFVNICMNPHSGLDEWFIYEYFEGTLEKDLRRYPSPSDIEKWLLGAGFDEVTFQVGERLQNRIIGKDIFPLPKDYTSQLSLLTDQQYAAGIRKMQDYVDSSYSKNVIPEFKVDISLSMVTARTL
ncbi:class I SAM-dependent methyltransferase [Thermodesulfobacteriota bacterium]